MHILDYTDSAMKYEGLARAVFGNCVKYGDPFGYAAQDHYTNFVGRITLDGRRALSTIMIKMILDHPKHSLIQDLKQLDDEVWKAEQQNDIIKIIDKAIEIGQKLNY